MTGSRARARQSHRLFDVKRARYREQIPSFPTEGARILRGLPSSWEESVGESSIDALKRRADGVAVSLARHGRKREAEELRRRIDLLERADELHRHASDLETLVGLYRALSVFAHDEQPLDEDAHVWAQVGRDSDSSTGHGAAFRETAALRNRAFRWLVLDLARYAHEDERRSRA